MVASAFTAPHVSEWVTCDVSATMDLLERLKARREFAELRLSPLLVIAKAVCLALQRTPELNSALGRGGAGDRAEVARSTSASLPPRRAGWWCRT